MLKPAPYPSRSAPLLVFFLALRFLVISLFSLCRFNEIDSIFGGSRPLFFFSYMYVMILAGMYSEDLVPNTPDFSKLRYIYEYRHITSGRRLCGDSKD